jgi:hypothetical protein
MTEELLGLVCDKRKADEFIEIAAGTTGFVLMTHLTRLVIFSPIYRASRVSRQLATPALARGNGNNRTTKGVLTSFRKA